MITDPRAYEELCEEERWAALRAMSAEESIALAEALLTSEIMAVASFDEGPGPVSLAVALGIRTPER